MKFVVGASIPMGNGNSETKEIIVELNSEDERELTWWLGELLNNMGVSTWWEKVSDEEAKEIEEKYK